MLVWLRPLLQSTVHKHKVLIFNCKQNEEPHAHIVGTMASIPKKQPYQYGKLYLTGILLSVAVIHLMDEYFCLELGNFDCLIVDD